MTFSENDIYVIHSISTEGKNGYWVKCETWNFDGSDIYVFNRPGCFGTLQSDDGDYTGQNEVILICKKFKSISEALKFDNLDLDDSEKTIFNYNDVLSHNFMIAGGIVFHQKFSSKILGELNPWGYSDSVNRDLYNINEDDTIDVKELGFEIRKIPYCAKSNCELCEGVNYSWSVETILCPCENECPSCSEAQLYKNMAGESYIKPKFGEDVYDDEGSERDVMLKWFGRVEGNMLIYMEYGNLVFQHNRVSLDYLQVIIEN